jgi:hypothetical protein
VLELPFDQYQRYRVAADLVTALDPPRARPVVDVGGGAGLVEAFFPDGETVVVNPETKQGPLPFGDRAVAVALALDTLEHVDPAGRSNLLSELCRIADIVVVSAPFAREDVVVAEAALREFGRERLAAEVQMHMRGGGDAEHRLPDLEETEAALAAEGFVTATLPSGYLPRWLPGMLLREEFVATGMPEQPLLNAIYNTLVSPYDCREPSYRHVVLAGRDLPSQRVAAAVDSLRNRAIQGEGEIAAQVTAAVLVAHSLQGSVQWRSRDLLQAEIARLVGDVTSRDVHIEDLERQVEELEGRVEKLQDELQTAQDAVLREARRSISSVGLQRASDWWERRKARSHRAG